MQTTIADNFKQQTLQYLQRLSISIVGNKQERLHKPMRSASQQELLIG